MKRRVTRIPTAVVFGVAGIAAATSFYASVEATVGYITPGTVELMLLASYAYFGVLILGILSLAIGLMRYLADKAAQLADTGFVPLTPGSLIPHLLSLKKYRRYFLVSTLLYGLLYAFVTSVIVYQPTVDFLEAYHAAIPSVFITTCCGPALSVPTVTVYVVNHLGLLIVPSTLLLMLVVAPLVGVNVVLAAFAYNSRAPGASRYWLGGVGAVVGLFTGCPTCAGLFFAGTIGGTGAISFATFLSYYQPEFIAASIPVLVATLYFVPRSLPKAFEEGCVVLTGVRHPKTD